MRSITAALVTALSAFTIILFTTFPAIAEEEARDTYIVPEVLNSDSSWLGGGSSQYIEIREKLIEQIKIKTGITLVFKKFDLPEDKSELQIGCSEYCFDLFRNGEADLAYMSPKNFAKAVMEGVPVDPAIMFTVDGKKTARYCLYIRKEDNEKFKTVENLRGYKLSIGDTTASLYQILFENGIDTDFRDFFSEIIFTPNSNGLYALAFGEVDVLHSDTGSMKFFMQADRRFSEIEPLVCTKEEYGNSLMVARKGIHPDVRNKLEKVILGMHKDRDFGFIHFFFYALNGKFVKANLEDYATYIELLERAEENGWDID